MKTFSEHGQALLFGAVGLRRILVPPVERFVDAREDRTGLPRLVAHGDDVVERLAEVLVHGLRARPGRIDPGFGKDLQRSAG